MNNQNLLLTYINMLANSNMNNNMNVMGNINQLGQIYLPLQNMPNIQNLQFLQQMQNMMNMQILQSLNNSNIILPSIPQNMSNNQYNITNNVPLYNTNNFNGQINKADQEIVYFFNIIYF